MKKKTLNRRNFLKGSAAFFAYTSLGAHTAVASYPKKTYRVALLGIGWYGKSDLFRLMQVASVDVVALCDVDENQLNKAVELVSRRQKTGRKPRPYSDYKKLLAENPLDIVLIGSPDHWHALMCIDAIKAGCHVYVQKPVGVDVMEGEAMVAAARKYNKVVQVGTQRRSTPFLEEAKREIIEKGRLGKIAHVEICCYYAMRNNENPPEQEIPSFFDYDRWTGPAPLRPYDGLPHIRWWRAFMEYGNGILGDMCIHMLDAVRWSLGLGWPKRISSVGGIYQSKGTKSNITDTQHAVFEFDELNVIWTHRSWGIPPDSEYPWSYKFYGDKGTLVCSPMKYDFTPKEAGEGIHREVDIDRVNFPEDLNEEQIELHAAPATRAHMQNFIAAIEHNNKPVADILEGHISSASCILANISCQLGGRSLVYDSASRTVVGDLEATQLLTRPYRNPYIHPHPDQV